MLPADGHFGPFRWLDDTEDHVKIKWQAAYEFRFTFSGNHDSMSHGFREKKDRGIEDVIFRCQRRLGYGHADDIQQLFPISNNVFV